MSISLVDPLRYAETLVNQAFDLAERGRFAEALASYDEALLLIRQHDLPAHLADCLMNRATCLDALGRSEDALAAYDEALPLYRKHALPADLARCLMNRANCLARLSRYEEALVGYDDSFAAEDRASTFLQDPTHRLLARAQTTSRYRGAVFLAQMLAQRERSWSYSQRAKGRTLTDLLAARAELTALDRQELRVVQQRDAG